MSRQRFHGTLPLTLATVLVLVLLVAACGAAATPTPVPVPATATKAPAAAQPTATTAAAAPTATTAAAAAPTATKAAAAPTAAAPAATAPSGAGQVSFAKAVLPIFQKTCIRCHGGGNPRSGLSLESYQGVMKGGTNAPDVVPGSPDKSNLCQFVTNGTMPFGGPKLAASDIQTICDWVQQGAQNN